MDHIEWIDSYSVGIPSIDEQHQRLVAMANRLFTAIMDDAGESVLGEILDELTRYAHYHFGYEEHLLKEHGYPEEWFTAHKIEHEKLTAGVREYTRQFEEDADLLDLNLYTFLRDWMDEHLHGSDSRYADFLVDRGVR